MAENDTDNIAFSSLDLTDSLQKGLTDVGFTHCTPIQALTLPIALAGQDVAGQAQTGTGKTAAFLLATMHHLLNRPRPPGQAPIPLRALILAPTRELAVQIHKDAMAIGAHTDLRLGLVYGGTGYESQRKVFEQGVDILIGTPGRTIDYFKQGLFQLKAIEAVVLDEADRMFDLGFIKDIRYLLRRMRPPTKRLNMLFSATLSWRVTELAYEHMNNPEIIKIEAEQVTATKIQQAIYYVANEEKIPLLIGLLKHIDPKRTIVFVNTKRVAELVWGYLVANGINSALLSGNVPQKMRLKLLLSFEQGEIPVLVATDVAARGLHIPEVSHVINFDLPQDAQDYVHRVGRTARAGASGDAISFACEEYAFSLPDIEEYIGMKIPARPVTNDLLVKPQAPQRIKTPKVSSGRKRSTHETRAKATSYQKPRRPSKKGAHRKP